MHYVGGKCHCANIGVELGLVNAPGQYQPRACDCSFCLKHGAAYVSDASGSLRIRIEDPKFTARYRQGNALAEMLLCARCGVLIAALYSRDAQVHGTVNFRVIDSAAGFGSLRPVSPKELSGDQKVSRWLELWFHNVEIL